MRKAWSLVLVASLLVCATAAAEPRPAVLFMADGDVPLGEGVLTAELPDSNESRIRLLTAPSVPELLVGFAADEVGGSRLYGPAFAAFWPDKAMAENGSMLQVALRIDGQVIANQTVPVAFDPSQLPDPAAFIPPDPTDPEAAALHVVGQALPLIYTPYALVYFGFLDVEVDPNATVSVTFELIPAGPVPAGSALLKYDSKITPSYVYLPWWVPDPPVPTTSSPPPSASPSTTTTPPATSSAPAEQESPALPVVGLLALLGLACLAWRRW